LNNFWKWLGAGTAIVGTVLIGGLILKDQTGAVNVLNALGSNTNAVLGTLEKAG